MDSIRQIQKKYCSRAMTLAIATGFAFILAGQNALAKGLVLGTIFSAVNFILMGETLPLKINKTKGKAILLSLALLLLRYMILSIPLIAAIKFEQFNLAAAICGIFMVQFIIIVSPLWDLIFSFFEKKA